MQNENIYDWEYQTDKLNMRSSELNKKLCQNILCAGSCRLTSKPFSLTLTHMCTACSLDTHSLGKKRKEAWHVQTQSTQNNNGPHIKQKQPEGKLRTVLFSVILWNWSLNICQLATDSTDDLMGLNNVLEDVEFLLVLLETLPGVSFGPRSSPPLPWKSPSPTCCSPEASPLPSPWLCDSVWAGGKRRSEVTEGGLAEGLTLPLLDREPPSITVSPWAYSTPASKARWGKWGHWSYVACGSASMNHRSAADRFIWGMNISSSPWNNLHIGVKITVHSKI